MQKYLRGLTGAFALGFGALLTAPAQAIPQDVYFPANYEAIAFPAAIDTAWASGSGGHAIWFSDGSVFGTSSFIFETVGIFTKTGGTATLTGNIHQGNVDTNSPSGSTTPDTGNSFTLSATFSYIGDGPDASGTGAPTCSAKRELNANAYVPGPGGVDPCEWSFFNLDTATLTGTNDNDGLVVTLAHMGPPVQTGIGANGKNLDTGLSGWWSWEVTANPNNVRGLQVGTNSGGGHGDFNIDWDVVVPEPGTLAVFGAALLGLAGLRRRRR